LAAPSKRQQSLLLVPDSPRSCHRYGSCELFLHATSQGYAAARTFYYRTQAGGADKAVSLGQDYHEALRRFADIKTRGLPAPKLTMAAAIEQWLVVRVATGRNPHNLRKARARAEKYTKPYMGRLLLSKVTANHLREFRLWLEARPGVHGRKHLAPATIAWILGDVRNLLYWVRRRA
jgi:hypothetical protein